jgi:exopolysaccharide biosynthesis protein
MRSVPEATSAAKYSPEQQRRQNIRQSDSGKVSAVKNQSTEQVGWTDHIEDEAEAHIGTTQEGATPARVAGDGLQ